MNLFSIKCMIKFFLTTRKKLNWHFIKYSIFRVQSMSTTLVRACCVVWLNYINTVLIIELLTICVTKSLVKTKNFGYFMLWVLSFKVKNCKTDFFTSNYTNAEYSNDCFTANINYYTNRILKHFKIQFT